MSMSCERSEANVFFIEKYLSNMIYLLSYIKDCFVAVFLATTNAFRAIITEFKEKHIINYIQLRSKKMVYLTYIIAGVYILGVCIFIHELGHLLAGKMVGIKARPFP